VLEASSKGPSTEAWIQNWIKVMDRSYDPFEKNPITEVTVNLRSNAVVSLNDGRCNNL
jgi:hypothetical protein